MGSEMCIRDRRILEIFLGLHPWALAVWTTCFPYFRLFLSSFSGYFLLTFCHLSILRSLRPVSGSSTGGQLVLLRMESRLGACFSTSLALLPQRVLQVPQTQGPSLWLSAVLDPVGPADSSAQPLFLEAVYPDLTKPFLSDQASLTQALS